MTAEPAKKVLMGSHCAGSVRYYAALLQHGGHLIVDATERHLPLRHSHHRYEIDGPNGAVKLTVPLVGSTAAMPVPMHDVLISEHANWRHLHWGALMAAYGKSPYFDYIAPELQRIVMEPIDGNFAASTFAPGATASFVSTLPQNSLLALNLAMHQLVVDFMDLPITTEVTVHPAQILESCDDCVDMRRSIGFKHGDQLTDIVSVPYYQVWATRHGFQNDLSILDLLMNEGREGIVTLMRMAGIHA